jgi:hypothetical protein
MMRLPQNVSSSWRSAFASHHDYSRATFVSGDGSGISATTTRDMRIFSGSR